MANDDLLTPAQELDAISKALAARVKSLSNIKGYRTQKSLNEERDRRIAATYAWLRKVVEARNPLPSPDIDPNREATLHIMYMGSVGCLKDTVPFNSTDEEIRQIATKAVQTGAVRGIVEDPIANFADFVTDRLVLSGEARGMIQLRPKIPF